MGIVVTGSLLYNALKAAQQLEADGIGASVLHMATIKPLDTEMLEKFAIEHDTLMTVEEHQIAGGLGSAVAETLATFDGRSPLLSLGLPDHYEYSGEYRDILEKSGLVSKEIANSVLRRLAIDV